MHTFLQRSLSGIPYVEVEGKVFLNTFTNFDTGERVTIQYEGGATVTLMGSRSTEVFHRA